MGCAIHGSNVDRNRRDAESMRMPARSLKGRNPRTRKQNEPFIDTYMKKDSTAPIPCAPPSRDELSDLELERELQEMYKIATWQMYHRIQSARRTNISIAKSGTNVATRHQSISSHSNWSQESTHANNYNDEISQFHYDDHDHDQPFAFNDFEM
mmetsp:Transcript_33088/g.39614  ORF Transcript_33088/g.39614 Transcript_33088/m.39614 type:complete len:154 (+) Transcript_33088:173-634(+)